MATSKIEIIKRAASITGNGSLVSVDDNAEVARLVDEHYEAIVSDALVIGGYPWARRSFLLSRLDIDPEPPWRVVWQRPTALMMLHYVVGENGVQTECEERDFEQAAAILTIQDCPKLWAVGTTRVSEGRWPADFATVIQKRMEAVFRKGISEQTTEGNRDEAVADDREIRALVRSQRSGTARDAREWDLTKRRRPSGILRG
ncbi:MAG: hypothetical protein ACK4E3_03610 [Brevundimonas sp.]|uniref:hypothetical protein n=1 Tax=Brevundimonas sp. TaxID=1871086 RepID=UPI00391AF478